MLFSELAKRVAEKYPEVKTAYPMDCELSNVELYDPSGAVPPVDSLSIYTARQISQDMTLPLCFVCAGTPDQAAHDKIAYSDSNYIIIPQVSVVDVVYYIMSLFGDSFKQQKLYSNLIYMLLNGADLTSVFCEFSKGTGSQLLAIDISSKVLAYSKPFMVNHPHWIHSIEVGYLDNYLIEYILSYRVKHKMDMSPNTFVLFCNRLQMYIKVIRVIADNEIIGYVFMGNYTGEFPWFSDKLMHLLAKNLHSTLLGSRSYSTYRFNMHQSVLSDIIDGASEEETIQRINAAKLTFPPNMRAVVLKPSYFRGNEYLYDVLMPRVAEILPASPRVHKKNAIVTFVGVDNAGALPEETRTAIETLAADGQVLVGVSNLFHKPSKLYVYYQQALQAMSFSRRLSNTGGVFFFSDYAFYIMLDRMEDKPLLEQCRHPVLANLRRGQEHRAVRNAEDLYQNRLQQKPHGRAHVHAPQHGQLPHPADRKYVLRGFFGPVAAVQAAVFLLHRRVFEKPLFRSRAAARKTGRRMTPTTRARQFCRARARFLLPEYRKEHLPGGRCSCSLCGCGSAQSS